MTRGTENFDLFFFTAYNTTGPNVHKGCSFNFLPPLGKTCEVDLKQFDPCVREKSYGLYRKQPCVFLKLTKDADWVPQFYNESRLPEDMPGDLKVDIKNYIKTDRKNAVRISLTSSTLLK